MPPSDGVERAEAQISQAVTLPLRGGIAAFPTDTLHGPAVAVLNSDTEADPAGTGATAQKKRT